MFRHSKNPLLLTVVLACGGCDVVSALLAPIGAVGAVRVTKPYLQMEDSGGIVVSWFTPAPLIGTLEVQSYDDPSVQWSLTEDQPVRHHIVPINGLVRGATYRYRLTGSAATDTGWHRLIAPLAAGQRIVLAVLGDSGVGLPAQYSVANQIAASDADYVLHAGDVVYPGGSDFDYDRGVFLPFSAFMSEKPLLPCLGNHDVATLDGAAYLENFILPRNGPSGLAAERCYSANLGDVHLASLDLTRDAGTLTKTIIPWLRADMQASSARWKIVMFHFPLYTSGTNSRRPNNEQLALWGGLFDELGIDLCIAGHNHYYERSMPLRAGEIVPAGQGTVYLVCGNGGAPLYAMAPRASFSAAANDQVHGYTRIAIEGSRVELSHLDGNGTVMDQAAWDKP